MCESFCERHASAGLWYLFISFDWLIDWLIDIRLIFLCFRQRLLAYAVLGVSHRSLFVSPIRLILFNTCTFAKSYPMANALFDMNISRPPYKQTQTPSRYQWTAGKRDRERERDRRGWWLVKVATFLTGRGSVTDRNLSLSLPLSAASVARNCWLNSALCIYIYISK